MNLEFFDMLYRDPGFCEMLGRVTLAAGRFESDLRTYLQLRGVEVSDQAGLGHLIAELERNRMLSENGVQVLRTLKMQRNYLTHSLFDLFSARVDETVLPRDDLVPEDVSMFAEKAWQLEQNLKGLTQIVEESISKIRNTEGDKADNQIGLLFRP